MYSTNASKRVSKWILLAAVVALVGCAHGNSGYSLPVSEQAIDSLFEAAGKGDVSRVGTYLNQRGDPNVRSRIAGPTLLHLAASRGEPEMVGILLAHQANPNVLTESQGISPLQAAIANGHYAIAIKLLNSGADPNLRDPTLVNRFGALPTLVLQSRNQIDENYYLLIEQLLAKNADVTGSTSFTKHASVLDTTALYRNARAFRILWCGAPYFAANPEQDVSAQERREEMLKTLGPKPCGR